MDTAKITERLEEWQLAIRNRQAIHFRNAHRLEKLHYAVGLPTTILAAITSATIFSKLDAAISPNLKLAMAILSLIAGVFAAVQTFYSFAKRGESNRSIAAQFGQIDRAIGILTLFLPTNPKELEQKITKLNEQISNVTATAPTVELPKQLFQPTPKGSGGSTGGGSSEGGGGSGGSIGTGFSGPIIMSPPPTSGPVSFT
jgi:uncharacterized membrane protein YgcG